MCVNLSRVSPQRAPFPFNPILLKMAAIYVEGAFKIVLNVWK